MHNIAAKVITELNKLKKTYDTYILEMLDMFHMTKLEIDILGFLANNPDYDTAKDIELVRQFKKSNISTAVDALLHKGMITKIQDANDRRIMHLKLMEEASPIVQKIQAVQENFFKQIFQDISKSEMEQYFTTFMKMMDNASRIGECYES
ncbi:MAG: MarR family transcriptional regulator [Anaeroplasma bactoclasticum]|nr:MarR family transcriptional regulator [Anaeroplasma bactoclasticum]